MTVDESFTSLPLGDLAEAALSRAHDLGAEHADFRVETVRSQNINLRDGNVDGVSDSSDSGLSVRVVYEGTWGFAAGVVLTPTAPPRWPSRPSRWPRCPSR